MSEPDQPRVKRSRFDTSEEQNGGVKKPRSDTIAQENGGVQSSTLASGSAQPAAVPASVSAVLAKARESLAKLKALQAAKGGQAALPRPNAAATQAPPAAAAAGAKAKTVMPAPLRLDDQGREVDEQGRPIIRKDNSAAPALKLNERVDKPRKAEPKAPQPPPLRIMYDPVLGDRLLRKQERRPRSNFDFVQEGRFQKQAEMQRLRAQYGDEAVKVQQQQQRRAREAAAAAAGDANLIPLGQRELRKEEKKKEPELDPIPDVEWWDARILLDPKMYGTGESGEDVAANLNPGKITHLVEHPVPIEPPVPEAPAAPMPLMLTKKERKKLRTQRRNEREKEKQELIRQGLLEPPKAKVKISNLMRVLGTEAVADPSAVEKQVREQMAEREQAHGDRNLARKLTPKEKKEKKHKKLVGEAREGDAPVVSVYVISKLTNPSHHFKVRVNAEELHMKGCLMITEEGLSVVVVEGGPKAQKRYSKVLLQRIDWAAGIEDADAEPPPPGPEASSSVPVCKLAWTGDVRAPAFEKFQELHATSAADARKQLESRSVAHYWDLAEAALADTG